MTQLNQVPQSIIKTSLQELRWADYFIIFYILTVGLLSNAHGLAFIISLYGFSRLRNFNQALSRDEKSLIISFILYILVALLSLLFISHTQSAYDKFMRLLTLLWSVPLYLVLRDSIAFKKNLHYMIPISSVLMLFASFYSIYYLGQLRVSFYTNNVMFFGYVAATLSIFSLILSHKYQPRILFYLGGLSGLINCMLSGTRGALLGIYVGLLILIFSRQFFSKRIKTGLIVLVLLMPFLLSMHPFWKVRITSAITTMQHLEQNSQSSLGLRLLMWDHAWELYKTKPFFGLGLDGYDKQTKQMAESGLISQSLASFGHPHNVFLSSMVSMGLLGLLSLLAVFIVPLHYFRKRSRLLPTDAYSRMGAVFIPMIMTFGLTEAIFERQAIIAFYAVMVMVLFSATYHGVKGRD